MWLSAILLDLRYAARTLRRGKAFTALAIIILALGMGASVAIFSLLDSVLFKSLAVKDPARLALLTDPTSSGVSIGTNDNGPRAWLTYTEFVSVRQHMTSFSHVFAVDSSLRSLNAIIDRGVPEEIRLHLVSGDYFVGLGVSPQVGRTFTASDEHGAGSAPFAVISYAFWRDRFALAANVLSRSLSIQACRIASSA